MNVRTVTPHLAPKGRHELVLDFGHGQVTLDDHDHLIRVVSQILAVASQIHKDRQAAEQAAAEVAEASS